MDVILHIGDAKCGSSAIQSSLHKAQGALLEQGLLYHAPRPISGHFSYITLMGGKTRGNNADQHDIATQNIDETRDLIRKHTPDYLILSGENFFPVAPQAMIPLMETILGAAPDAVHVVAYLRHPVPLYLSTIQQILRANHEFPPPATYRRDTPGTFQRWKADPLCRSVAARLFDRKSLAGGTVTLDFQEYLQRITGRSKIALPDVDANVSLSAEQTVLLQKFRQDFLADQKIGFSPVSNHMIHFFEQLNAVFGLVGTKASLKDEVKACLVEKNLPFMEKLDRMFPDLAIVASAGDIKGPWAEASDHWTHDVVSILATHDPDIVQHLKMLIPDYNRELEKGVVKAALKALAALGLPKRSYGPFRDYLKKCGLPEAAHAVESAFRQAAR